MTFFVPLLLTLLLISTIYHNQQAVVRCGGLAGCSRLISSIMKLHRRWQPSYPPPSPSFLGLLLLIISPILLLYPQPVTSFQASSRFELLQSLGREISSFSHEPQELGNKMLESLSEIEASGSFVTRTELECLLRNYKDRQALASVIEPAQSSRFGSTYSYQVLSEAMKEVNGEQALHLWRRNVALRQNRVLMPARAADLYALMINTNLAEGEWELPQQALQYVGLTPAQYYNPTTQLIDMRSLSVMVAQTMLDLDVVRMEWERTPLEERGDEPLRPKEKGDDIAEWHWKQVLPPGGEPLLEKRACDFTLAVLRIASRHAAHATPDTAQPITVQLQDGADKARIRLTKQGFYLPEGSVDLVLSHDDIPFTRFNIKQ